MRVAVVGAGVIGAGIAWQSAVAGNRVTLVAPDTRPGASVVAGGMLAPVTEAWPGEEDLLELGSDSLRRWPEFAARLTADGHDPGLRTDGTVVAAVDGADRAELVTLAEFLGKLDRDVELLTARQLRALEPSLGASVRAGLSVPGDLAVDNRRLLRALLAAGAARGVEPVNATVSAVRPGEVALAHGPVLPADVVVIAAGAWSAGLHPALEGVVRPVKGEILRLRARPGSLPPPTRTVRGLVEGRHVYLVPRDEGGVVVGATQYEAGFDPGARVGGVRDLLADAERLVPGVADYVLEEAGHGFRPGTRDNLPVVRWLEPGVLAATGHGRNGMLLLPGALAGVAGLLGEGRHG
ncbi:MAG TPA: glycine oxidase ThiO [Pseudonocardiaceae bacterium]|jgi:glycine oxidase|nr:glycine oxidase ThiO [Pseudonocardiaceae bacterium]